MASPPLPWLMEELIEEILLRLAPEEPASLVRAALVCKPWRRLVFSPRFQRRFREFHRTAPMLGFLCNHHQGRPSFVRTSASSSSSSSSPLHASSSSWRGLDARHGRVLLREPTDDSGLVVWDPVTDDRWALPFPPRRASSCTAAVLCAGAAAAAGDCDHHDCQLGPFVVVFVGTDPHDMFVCTYDSSEYYAAWSEPISVQHPSNCFVYSGGYSPAVLLGSSKLYFGIPRTNTALQYDLEQREISWIQLPALRYCYQRCVLTATEDGLGLVSLSDGKLSMWLRMDDDDTPESNHAGGWIHFKEIHLGWRLRRVDPVFTPDYASVVGFADGLDLVFVTVNGVLCTLDLKTYVVKKVYTGREINAVFPFMRFYTPALEAALLGGEPSELDGWM